MECVGECREGGHSEFTGVGSGVEYCCDGAADGGI